MGFFSLHIVYDNKNLTATFQGEFQGQPLAPAGHRRRLSYA